MLKRIADYRRVSVVIANPPDAGAPGEHKLRCTLSTLFQQTLYPNEILVVDDSPIEKDIVDNYVPRVCRQFDIPYMRYSFFNNYHRLFELFNIGASVMRSPIVLFSTYDCMFFPRAIELFSDYIINDSRTIVSPFIFRFIDEKWNDYIKRPLNIDLQEDFWQSMECSVPILEENKTALSSVQVPVKSSYISPICAVDAKYFLACQNRFVGWRSNEIYPVIRGYDLIPIVARDITAFWSTDKDEQFDIFYQSVLSSPEDE